MLKKTLQKFLLVMLSCFTVLAISIPAQAAAAGTGYPDGMLTAPPPAMDLFGRYEPSGRLSGLILPQGSLNPGDIYLERGTASIGLADSGDIYMFGRTTAYKFVEEIGVQLTLQRWTGSYWTSVYVSSAATTNNVNMITTSDVTSGLKGYYYRVVATNWIKHKGVHEEGKTYGDSWAYN